MMSELIVLKKEVFDLLKKDGIYIFYLFLLTLLVFKVAFYSDSIIVLIRSVSSIFWIFVVPGYFAMLFWHEKLNFVQRIVIGIAIAAGFIGTASYYLGLAGFNIKYHALVLPLLMIALGFVFAIKNKGNKAGHD